MRRGQRAPSAIDTAAPTASPIATARSMLERIHDLDRRSAHSPRWSAASRHGRNCRGSDSRWRRRGNAAPSACRSSTISAELCWLMWLTMTAGPLPQARQWMCPAKVFARPRSIGRVTLLTSSLIVGGLDDGGPLDGSLPSGRPAAPAERAAADDAADLWHRPSAPAPCVLSAALAASKIFWRASGRVAGAGRDPAAYQLSELTLGDNPARAWSGPHVEPLSRPGRQPVSGRRRPPGGR